MNYFAANVVRETALGVAAGDDAMFEDVNVKQIR